MSSRSPFVGLGMPVRRFPIATRAKSGSRLLSLPRSNPRLVDFRRSEQNRQAARFSSRKYRPKVPANTPHTFVGCRLLHYVGLVEQNAAA
jgi:hypothetical protein